MKSRCGLDDSQSLSGQLVAWTAGGLVKLLIRSTHGLNDSQQLLKCCIMFLSLCIFCYNFNWHFTRQVHRTEPITNTNLFI